MRADKTRRLMHEMGVPKYASGIGIPNDAKFLREMEQAQQNIVVQHQYTNKGQDTDKVVSEMRILRASMEKILTAILEKSPDVYLDNEIISRKTYEQHGAIYAREGI